MIRNYLLTALRNIGKQWTYVIINIVGLALALAVCITAFYNNKWDRDFDKIHANYQYLYKIYVTKEIGIRKVVGATILKVMQVVSQPYLYIIGIALVVGLTTGYYNAMLLMDSLWTQHIGATLAAFTLPLVIILLVAALTVTGKIYHASAQNPARSLRDE